MLGARPKRGKPVQVERKAVAQIHGGGRVQARSAGSGRGARRGSGRRCRRQRRAPAGREPERRIRRACRRHRCRSPARAPSRRSARAPGDGAADHDVASDALRACQIAAGQGRALAFARVPAGRDRSGRSTAFEVHAASARESRQKRGVPPMAAMSLRPRASAFQPDIVRAVRIAAEVDVFDEHVGGEQQILAAAGPQDGAVVADAEHIVGHGALNWTRRRLFEQLSFSAWPGRPLFRHAVSMIRVVACTFLDPVLCLTIQLPSERIPYAVETVVGRASKVLSKPRKPCLSLSGRPKSTTNKHQEKV